MKEDIEQIIYEIFGTKDLEFAMSLCSDTSYSNRLAFAIIRYLLELEKEASE